MHEAMGITRRAYAAFSARDLATVAELIAPDCTWRVGGRSQVSGVYVGREEVLGFFSRLAEVTDGTFQVTLDDLGELNSGLVAAVATISGARAGLASTCRITQLIRVNQDGQLQESWWFAEDQHAADELLGDAVIRLSREVSV